MVLQMEEIWDQASVRRQRITVKGDAVASFLVPAERRLRAPRPPATFVRAVSDLLAEQAHLSILCWNPGPERRINHIAGRWHMVVALQESAEFLQHEDITRQFHVAHSRGCATHFNKHTFEPDLDVKSIYVPADKAYCCG